MVQRIRDAVLANSAGDMLRDILKNATATARPVQSLDGRPLSLVILNIDSDNYCRLRNIQYSLYNDPKVMCHLDIVRFGLTSRYILDNAYDDPVGVLICVNFSTIRDRQKATEFFRMCRDAPDLVKNFTVFVIENIPPETNEGIIQDAVRATNASCRSCFIKIDRPDHAALKLSGQLLSGFIMAYPDIASRILIRDDTKRRLFSALKAKGTDLMVDGLRKKSELLKVRKLPVRYFSIST